MEEYILINSKKGKIECFSRGEDGLWMLQNHTKKNPEFQFKSIDFTGKMIDLYEEVDLSDLDY